MSFRLRLTLFFVLIVVLPMVALAVLVSQVASDSESGKADARLSAELGTATTVFEHAQADSRRVAGEIANDIAADPAAVSVLRSGDRTQLQELAREQASDLVSLRLTNAAGTEVTVAKSRGVPTASVDLTAEGQTVGAVAVATTSSSELLDQIEEATGEDAALVGPGGPITGTVPIEIGSLPESGESATLDAGEGDLRVAATEPLGTEQVRIALP